MKIQTKNFGEVEIADNKIITFDKGIIGFPELKHFTMLHDEEKGSSAGIRYLQSIEEPSFAMPVMDPLLVTPDYDPEVDDELLTGVGTLTPENILVMASSCKFRLSIMILSCAPSDGILSACPRNNAFLLSRIL